MTDHDHKNCDHDHSHDHEHDDFAIDAALNSLAIETLNFMNKKVQDNKDIPEEEYAYVMLHASEAVYFNILMHIAEQNNLDPAELIEQTKANFTSSLEHIKTEGGDHIH